MENVMAVVDEKELGKEVSAVEKLANSLVITNDIEYSMAGEYTKQVKNMRKKVTDYWEPMRISTYNAYKAVTDHKKQMVDPLDRAERILKGKISGYIAMKEKERRAREEEARRQAQAEIERKLREAAEADKNEKAAEAESAMAQAEVIEHIAQNIYVPKQETPKVSGISKSVTWKITNIDPTKVPVNFGGVEIRPVDERAVMALIKASKGKIQIPGITFEEDYIVRARV